MIIWKDFLHKYNISEEFFKDADISREDLEYIYTDYLSKQRLFTDIMKEFVDRYLSDLDKSKFHSFRYRIKEPEHLIEKIIRKRKENYRKYKDLTKDNYLKFITDIIGIRGLILFKEQWIDFHKYIIDIFENSSLQYISDYIKDFDEDINHTYIAEPPVAHIRDGDDRRMYRHILRDECILSQKIYRSVHYVLKYRGIYLEIQVRTLFEEGWGEIEHDIVYPYNINDKNLINYSKLLNRLVGLADEMGSYFNTLRTETADITINGVTAKEQGPGITSDINMYKDDNLEDLATPNDIVNHILHE